MRGFPNNPVPCELCGAPGFPANRRCRLHWPPTARLKYPFDAAKDAIVRATWQNPQDYKSLTLAINDAVRRIGYPRYIVRMRAQRLGLTFDTRHKWEPWEERYLMQNAGVISPKRMQRALGHGWTRIEAKMASMGLRAAIREGMTVRDLCMGTGASHHTVAKWEANGWLRRYGGRFSEATVRTFVQEHPEQYDLRKVNQEWFKALLFPSADCYLLKLEKDPYRKSTAA